MELPSVVHPKRFAIAGIFFEVVSYSTLTDAQAKSVALMFYRSHRFSRKDKGRLFRVLSGLDESSSDLL